MKTLIVFFLVLPLFMLAACGDDDPPVVPSDNLEDDEYAVWSATLDSMVVWEKDDFVVLQSGTDGYVLNDSATAAYLRGQLKVPDDALQNHAQRNAQAATIERKLSMDVDYALLGQKEIEDLLTLGGYDELYRRYPKCNGVTTLSRVGFNSTRSMAVVYLSMTPGYLAGSGWAVLLRKISGKWGVTASTIVWVS
jgi:hypothetical protein